MSRLAPVPLTAVPVELDSPEFKKICEWPYEDSFVGRLLRDDIPQRVVYGEGQVWLYKAPNSQPVGFGSIDICDVFSEYTDGRVHPYIPLLAVNPLLKSQGYGTSIVTHLIAEAVLRIHRWRCHESLFLDVYTTSPKAIDLYERMGFVKVCEEPFPDEKEGKSYFIMAKRLGFVAA